MTATSPPPDTAHSAADRPYTVVWNDAVDLRHLAASIVLCVAVGLPAFLGARALFTTTVSSPALAGGYALLVGLLGCVLGATVCARLFRPKRSFGSEEHASGESARAELARLGGTAAAFAELPPAVQAEMAGLRLAPVEDDRTTHDTAATDTAPTEDRT